MRVNSDRIEPSDLKRLLTPQLSPRTPHFELSVGDSEDKSADRDDVESERARTLRKYTTTERSLRDKRKEALRSFVDKYGFAFILAELNSDRKAQRASVRHAQGKKERENLSRDIKGNLAEFKKLARKQEKHEVNAVEVSVDY